MDGLILNKISNNDDEDNIWEWFSYGESSLKLFWIPLCNSQESIVAGSDKQRSYGTYAHRISVWCTAYSHFIDDYCRYVVTIHATQKSHFSDDFLKSSLRWSYICTVADKKYTLFFYNPHNKKKWEDYPDLLLCVSDIKPFVKYEDTLFKHWGESYHCRIASGRFETAENHCPNRFHPVSHFDNSTELA